jgi:drug/metabolite transporter (DMT)-like permease
MLAAGLAMTAWGLAFERIDLHRALATTTLEAVAYLAIFGTAIAFSLNHWLLQRISSGLMGLSALMIPVLAVAVGALFGGEIFGARDIAGAALVTGGVWLSLTRARPLVVPTTEPHPAV